MYHNKNIKLCDTRKVNIFLNRCHALVLCVCLLRRSKGNTVTVTPLAR